MNEAQDQSNGSQPTMRATEMKRPSAFARLAPLVAVLGSIAVLAGVVALTEPTTSDSVDVAEVGATISDLPEGVLTYTAAAEQGIENEYDWGDRCDEDTGYLALPLSPPPDCFAPFTGDNGGSTSMGVTEDTVRVVVYTAMANDPLLTFIYKQVGLDDSPEKIFESYESYAALLQRYYETYGRTVELIMYEGTGSAGDEVAANADAETIARDLEPFFVVGGPALTDAFADTLSANEIPCVSCSPSTITEFYEERAPYIWGISKNTDQNSIITSEYVGKRLNGGKAVYGGDAVKDQTRKFALIHVVASSDGKEAAERYESRLRDHGVELEEVVLYEDPLTLAGQAREIMARMKAAGVTSVLFFGDPLAPQTLTQNATEQGFFPEWVMAGAALVDTTIFGRTFDQEQWKHAFGPSNLFARVSPTVAGSDFLHRWYYDGEPPAAQQSALILPNLQIVYGMLQGMGPNVTIQAFRDILFNIPVIESSPISPQISWGERGIWPGTDYGGIDDQTEVWWDPEATGEDEIGNEGTGMWTYADGGVRYLPGTWPEEAPELFASDPDPIVIYDELPPGVMRNDYEPLPPL